MLHLNLLRGIRTGAIYVRPPRPDRAAECAPMVQLRRVIAGRLSPAPKLHRVGYVASPQRAAPLCRRGQGAGPYGPIVWVRRGQPLGRVGRQPIKMCPDCAAL